MNIRELPYNLYKNGTIEDRKLKTLLTSTGTLSQAIRLTPIQSSNSCEELPYTLYINGIKKTYIESQLSDLFEAHLTLKLCTNT